MVTRHGLDFGLSSAAAHGLSSPAAGLHSSSRRADLALLLGEGGKLLGRQVAGRCCPRASRTGLSDARSANRVPDLHHGRAGALGQTPLPGGDVEPGMPDFGVVGTSRAAPACGPWSTPPARAAATPLICAITLATVELAGPCPAQHVGERRLPRAAEGDVGHLDLGLHGHTLAVRWGKRPCAGANVRFLVFAASGLAGSDRRVRRDQDRRGPRMPTGGEIASSSRRAASGTCRRTSRAGTCWRARYSHRAWRRRRISRRSFRMRRASPLDDQRLTQNGETPPTGRRAKSLRGAARLVRQKSA